MSPDSIRLTTFHSRVLKFFSSNPPFLLFLYFSSLLIFQLGVCQLGSCSTRPFSTQQVFTPLHYPNILIFLNKYNHLVDGVLRAHEQTYKTIRNHGASSIRLHTLGDSFGFNWIFYPRLHPILITLIEELSCDVCGSL